MVQVADILFLRSHINSVIISIDSHISLVEVDSVRHLTDYALILILIY